MIKSIALERAAGNEFVPAEGNVGCEGLTPSEMILYAAGKAVGNDIIALLGSVAGRVMSLRITVEGSVVTRGKERSGTYREFSFATTWYAATPTTTHASAAPSNSPTASIVR